MPFPPVTKDSNFEYEAALDEHVWFFNLLLLRQPHVANAVALPAFLENTASYGHGQH